ncbi:MAG: hypothetical protein OQK29_03590, partial [Ignavibacteriaceae bacterium]|nr:hypothetical protein [Ignavibacteriaceae bacterium]
IQHRSFGVQNGKWSTFGGAVSPKINKKFEDFPISTRKSMNLIKNKDKLFSTLIETARNELYEESGYKIDDNELIR